MKYQRCLSFGLLCLVTVSLNRNIGAFGFVGPHVELPRSLTLLYQSSKSLSSGQTRKSVDEPLWRRSKSDAVSVQGSGISGLQKRVPVAQGESQASILSYEQGLWTIGFCTLVFASQSPVMHAAVTMESTSAGASTVSNLVNSIHAPSVLIMNAMVSVVAFLTVLFGGPLLENIFLPIGSKENFYDDNGVLEDSGSSIKNAGFDDREDSSVLALLGGVELGWWKFCGTTANLCGLALTTADHGAFLIQLTTLIVPVVQGLQGVPISKRIQSAVVLALAGIALFTSDQGSAEAISSSMLDESAEFWTATRVGDLLCVVAAGFYATYDLRLYEWGKLIAPRPLMVRKIAVQAVLSVALLWAASHAFEAVAASITAQTLSESDNLGWLPDIIASSETQMSWSSAQLILLAWSGIMVNALVPFLQVSGQQAIGPVASQTLYASQPLWAAIMSYVFLGETVGTRGWLGGSAFLVALFLAATAPPPVDALPPTSTAESEAVS